MSCGCNKPNVSSSQSMLGRNNNIPRTSLNSEEMHTIICNSITVSLLTLWKRKIDCMIENNYGDQIDTSNTQLTNTSTILESWIADKTSNPESCNYIENLPDTQRLINKIILKGLCL